MRLTFIHPAVGHQGKRPYIRAWQMEPLPPAVLAALLAPQRISWRGPALEVERGGTFHFVRRSGRPDQSETCG